LTAVGIEPKSHFLWVTCFSHWANASHTVLWNNVCYECCVYYRSNLSGFRCWYRIRSISSMAKACDSWECGLGSIPPLDIEVFPLYYTTLSSPDHSFWNIVIIVELYDAVWGKGKWLPLGEGYLFWTCFNSRLLLSDTAAGVTAWCRHLFLVWQDVCSLPRLIPPPPYAPLDMACKACLVKFLMWSVKVCLNCSHVSFPLPTW
jgi:hypothetical protein